MTTSQREAPEFIDWTWSQIEPQYRALQEREVTAETIDAFLRDWTVLSDRVSELSARTQLATDVDTADADASKRYHTLVTDTMPKVEEAEHRLGQKLLASNIVPADMEVPIRRLRVDDELFREENLPIQSEERLLAEKYFKITGGRTVEWDGQEIPISQLAPVLEEQDRGRRERAWRLGAQRRLQDRDSIDHVWKKLIRGRHQIASNAGFSDYRAYRWRDLKRFDYTTDDAQEFHRSVERAVIPAVTRIFERRSHKLGLSSIRPWDRNVDVSGLPPLHPYTDAGELEEKVGSIVHRVDPALGEHFDTMRDERLFDLASRKNKAPSAYCTVFNATGRPFIFGNATSVHDDVTMLLHEGGHAFHTFEMLHLPYAHQKSLDAVPIEFAEVGSMAMELLAAPYLTADEGGFYSTEDAARARLGHLQRILTLLCWVSVIDAFQHWAYEDPEAGADADMADSRWQALVGRFVPFVDWTGLELELRNDWRSITNLFGAPFYILEYALAQLGAVGVWANARRDQAEAVRQYRHALSLGGTRSLPDLFAASGIRFAFDEGTIRDAVTLIESTIEELEVDR